MPKKTQKTKITVLCVDDSTSVQENVLLILTKFLPLLQDLPDILFEVEQALSLNTAKKKIQEKIYDVYIIDNNLPIDDNPPKNKYGYINTSPTGYTELFPLLADLHNSLRIGSSSDEKLKPPSYAFKWDKSGMESWEDLHKLVLHFIRNTRQIHPQPTENEK